MFLSFLFHRDSWHPKYWALGLLLLILWLPAHMPLRWQLAYGRCLGRILYVCVKKIRYVTRCNIRACFPQLNDHELELAVKQTTKELGISLAETFLVWLRGLHWLKGRCTYEGREHVDAAIAEGKGVILLSCHFGAVDVGGSLISLAGIEGAELVGTYRQTDAPINRFLARVRGVFSDRMLAADDQRAVLRALRNGAAVWYAPDIEVRGKNTCFADFFGVKASTTLAISKLAKAGKAVVIPAVHYRDEATLNYTFKFFPPLTDVPSDDAEADTQIINTAIETAVKPYPWRYWWVIKRFKKRPEGETAIYC